MSEIPEDIGKVIKEVRERRGFSLEVLAERAGNLSHTTLSKIENGGKPSKRTLIALANATNDNFGLSWLDEHLTENNTELNKKKIIEAMTVEEIFNIKFGGEKSTKISKERLLRIKKLVDQRIEEMLDG